ncbi:MULTISPECIES: ribbon-helix-helix domain-containing protein [unclassified Azospirillum]|jgi:predicted DNA-binding ribbon-helix-helix protein|uniref:ribbon-helix-helix domain-containing protein n=1 Tax=unclassified Azospirillum TaxID=2630922 RepID=UPI000B697C21|nr:MULTISPECIES: ribbon-helix-helix domain-containing protein [unclassified Azospirillum]SNS78128.1 Ribbon-helix-helix domain-containing protein [Azospirillum sp. RU38E]SNS95382.1 Ribbon-helix-helix domain-containing protein [Azospirillum sp. RU37A]
MNIIHGTNDITVYEPHDLEVDGQLISHNVWVEGHRTSVRLEAVMWQALHEIAEREAMSIHQVISVVSRRQHQNASLTATIRAFLVAYYRSVSRGNNQSLLQDFNRS